VADHVVIVGGGLTGLVAAHELHRRGVPSLVLEAGHRLGGRVTTVQFPDGAIAEGGMEEFWDTSPAYELLRELGLPLIEQAAPSSVMLGARLHPFGAGGTAAYFDALDAGRDGVALWNGLVGSVLDELAVAHRTGCPSQHLQRLMRTSFASFVAGAGVPAPVQDWIRVVVESETAVEWDRIGALDGVDEMSPFVVDASNPGGHRNARVIGGNDRLIEALAASLPDGAVRLGASVRRVVDAAGGVEVTYDDADGRRRVARGHHAVLTPPLWQLGALDIEPGLDRRTRAALASGGSGSYVKVVLRLDPGRVRIWERDGEHPFPLLTDGPAGCVYLTDGRPSGHGHVLTMLIAGPHARMLAGRGHRDIAARGIDALEQLTDGPSGLPLLHGLRAAVTDSMVFDHPAAVAYWPHALGRSRFDGLAAALRAPHGRVLIGGDSTDSSHSDGAVRAGIRMAAHIADRNGYENASIMARTSSPSG
jgi:monoamine oxidase